MLKTWIQEIIIFVFQKILYAIQVVVRWWQKWTG